MMTKLSEWSTLIRYSNNRPVVIHHLIIIYPLIVRVAGTPHMISQPASSIFPCSPLPSGTWWTPGLSIPWCCLPTPFSVYLFFSFSLCLARWFWPDLMNRRLIHTTSVCISLWRSGSLHVVWLPAGSLHRLPCWKHGLWMWCEVSCGWHLISMASILLAALFWGSMIQNADTVRGLQAQWLSTVVYCCFDSFKGTSFLKASLFNR